MLEPIRDRGLTRFKIKESFAMRMNGAAAPGNPIRLTGNRNRESQLARTFSQLLTQAGSAFVSSRNIRIEHRVV